MLELDPTGRPAWWTPYELPPQLRALNPKPDSQFFQAGPKPRSTERVGELILVSEG